MFIRKTIIFLILAVSFACLSPSYADTVVYNTKTGKYHSASCEWAKKCTVNCIKIDRSEAGKRNGVPCKVCGAKHN